MFEGVKELRWKGIEYSVREHHRARRVILKVLTPSRLEVVVPRRFNRRRLPEIFQSHLDWIQRQLKMAENLPTIAAPNQVDLKAIDERWRVEYGVEMHGRNPVEERPGALLAVGKDPVDIDGIATALTTWLHGKAHAHLSPWLSDVSRETGIPFKKITVRGQTTRWASCSKLQNISLNRSLLFLPPQLVRHVFLHELCHIKRLDHSPNFWRILAELEPDCRVLEAQVRQGDKYVPYWVRQGRSR